MKRIIYSVHFPDRDSEDTEFDWRYLTEVCFSLKEAIHRGEIEVQKGNCPVSIERNVSERNPVHTELWDYIEEESGVILEAGGEGWIDWRNNKPDREHVPYSFIPNS